MKDTVENEYFLKQFFTLAIIMLISAFVLLVTVSGSIKSGYELSQETSNLIVSQIGKNGLNHVNKYGCDSVVAEFVQTNKWTDTWCFNHYRYLRLK